MKRCTFFRMTGLASAFALAVLLLQLPAVAQKGRLDEIQVLSEGLKGNLLGDSAKRNVTVYIPPEYDTDPERRYPVVYLLHGYTATNTFWTSSRFVQNLNIATLADKLIASGDIEPMILVAPDCHNEYGGSWYTNSPVTGNWEDFVTKDLICYIDAKYRTIPKRTSRAIAGHSMGGHGAIKIAMKHPELYCALYAMSPAWVDFSGGVEEPFTKNFVEAAGAKKRNAFPNLHWRARAVIALAAAIAPNPHVKPFSCDLPLDANAERVEGAWQKWLQQDLSTTMLAKYADNLRKYRAIAVDCGTEEDLLPTIIVFVEALKKAGVEHTFEKFQGDHTNRVASQLEKKVFPLFSRTLKSANRQPAAIAVP